MIKRLATAICIVLTLVGAVLLTYYVSPIAFDIYLLLWISVALFEMYQSFSGSGYKIFKTPIVFFALLVYPVFYLMQYYLGHGLTGIIIVFVASILIALLQFTFSKDVNLGINDVVANAFISVYPALMMSLAFYLLNQYATIHVLVIVLALPIMCDSFAYLFGRTIGGPKLCPSISPKKTIAGAVGGVFGCVITAVAVFCIFDLTQIGELTGYVPIIAHTVDGWQWKSALIYSAIGIFAGIVSELGDLIASRLKRCLGIKDYGKIFPGHGGVMDRMDSIIVIIFVIFVAFEIIYNI